MTPPRNIQYHQEWQRVVISPDGRKEAELESGWYRDEEVARFLLNDDYPQPTSTGFVFQIQTRWVSDPIVIE